MGFRFFETFPWRGVSIALFRGSEGGVKWRGYRNSKIGRKLRNIEKGRYSSENKHAVNLERVKMAGVEK